MDVQIKEQTADHLDKILTTEDHLVMQCLTCDTYLKPSELRVLNRRGRDESGGVVAEIVIQCPVCEPFVDDSVNPRAGYFRKLTREQYEMERAYQRSNLIMLDSRQEIVN